MGVRETCVFPGIALLIRNATVTPSLWILFRMNSGQHLIQKCRLHEFR